MTDLRTAALRALEAWQDQKGMKLLCEAMDDLGTALAYREDIAQAAFEHWLVEKLLTVTQAQMAHADATCKQDLQVEPCNKSCAPGYCYCEPIIKPEIKVDNAEPEQEPELRELLISAAAMAVAAERNGVYQGASWVADAVLAQQGKERNNG